MRLDDLHLWFLGDPAIPRYVGALKLVSAGKGVSLHYARAWLDGGFALSEDLPLVDTEFLPPGRLSADSQRAVGAVDDARPDRWGEKVIRFVYKPRRISLMEYLYYAGDDRFGALGVSTSPTSYSPRAGGALPRLEDAQQLSEVVAKIEASEPLSALEAKIIAGGGSPLGGAKPKALIDIDGEQWVIKFFNHEACRYTAHRACHDDAGRACRHQRCRNAGHPPRRRQCTCGTPLRPRTGSAHSQHLGGHGHPRRHPVRRRA